MALTAEASRDARWSTSDLSSDQAVSRWMELLSQTIAAMHIDSLDRKRFSASRQQVGLGPIDLNILEASPQRVQRTRSMISRQKADYEAGCADKRGMSRPRGKVQVSRLQACEPKVA